VLLIAESIDSDGDVDLRDEYRERVYREWTGGALLAPVAGLTAGRLHEPPGVGMALLVAPAYAIAGATGAELFVAALLALAFVAAASIARRLVPDPWATGAALAGGLSPPAIAWSTSVSPEPVAACAVAGAALFALRVRHAPAPNRAVLAALLIGALPWLNVKFLPVAAVAAFALARWLRRRRRGMSAFVALEVVLVSAVALITVNERLYGGLSPYSAVPGDPTGAASPTGYLERIPRLVEVFVHPDAGILAWAPFGVLAFLSLELLTRSLRERLSVALPSVVDVEVAAGFLALLCAAQVFVAAFLSPELEPASAFPGREAIAVLPVGAALCAWGFRHAPRIGQALVTLTVGAGAWLLIGMRAGDAQLAPPEGPLPYGALQPAVAALAAGAVVFLVGRELWRDRALGA
jgi:hypothetical protein